MSLRPPVIKPNLFIVGPAHSGTTALYYFLKQHPDIFMSEIKEPQFFSKDISKERDEFYGKKIGKHFGSYDYYHNRIDTENGYLELFENWNGERVIGEASTDYLPSEEAAQKIHKFNPNARIVIMLRNPIERLYSAYRHRIWTGLETDKTFNENMSKGKDPHLDICEQIQRYYELFDKSQIETIIYDDFRKDNAKTYRELLDFLKVDPSFTPSFELVNTSRIPRLVNVHIWLKFSLFTKLLMAPKYVLPSGLSGVYAKMIHPVLSIYKSLFTRKKFSHSLDLKLKKKLIKKFKPEVENLSKLVDRDLVSLWGYNKVK